MSEAYDAARQFLPSLRRVRRLSPADLARYQAPLIERLCRHAARQSPFYATRLSALFEGGDAASGGFRHQAWDQVPIFDRVEAQARNDDLHALSTPEAVGSSRRMRTSGSTGRPLVFHRSAIADTAALAQSELLYEDHGFDRTARMGWIHHAAGAEAWVERRRTGWNLTHPRAELCELSKAVATADCVDWLRRERPRHLIAAPSMVGGILTELRRSGGDPIALDRILVTSEAVPDDLSHDVAETFGARLVDAYGSRELGALADLCPDAGPAKHVAAETVLLEVIRADGAVAEPGEIGRVVATALYSYAMPLIRYDLGDLAIQGATRCACGRGAPLIERVLGRSNALFRFSDGTSRFPVGLKAIRRFVPLVQMQVIQTHMDRIEVRYAPDPAGGAPDFEAATAHLRKALSPDLTVVFTPTEAIALSAGGKFEELISHVVSPANVATP